MHTSYVWSSTHIHTHEFTLRWINLFNTAVIVSSSELTLISILSFVDCHRLKALTPNKLPPVIHFSNGKQLYYDIWNCTVLNIFISITTDFSFVDINDYTQSRAKPSIHSLLLNESIINDN